MLKNAFFTDFAMFLTLPCMLVTLFCILSGRNRNCIPTLISLGCCVTYAIILAVSGKNANSFALQTYLFLLVAFGFYTIIAYANYRHNKHKKAEYQKKLESFKQECIEARGFTQAF